MDWDLSAMVRSCNTSTPTNQNTQAAAIDVKNDSSLDNAFSYYDNFNPENEEDPFGFSNLIHNGSQNSCVPPLAGNSTAQGNFNILDSPVSGIGAVCGPFQPQLVQTHFQSPSLPPPPQTAVNVHQIQLHHQIRGPDMIHPMRATPSSSASKEKKKKIQKKIVMQVTAENLCSDDWSWRKYGQKPIKNSPYPRNYYRCSSSKGCTAKKQVERSDVDSNMLTVYYTGDHTHTRPVHRNSLAGGVRGKVPTNQNLTINDSEAAHTSPVAPLPTAMEHDTGNYMDEDYRMEVDGEFSDVNDVDDDEIEADDEDLLIPNINALDDDLLRSFQQLSSQI